MENMVNIDWDAEFSKHEGDVQAQWDIFTIKIREAVDWCIPKKVMSERTKRRVRPIELNHTFAQMVYRDMFAFGWTEPKQLLYPCPDGIPYNIQ